MLSTILVLTLGILVATFLVLCSTIWTLSSEDDDEESHSMVVCSSSDEAEESIVITSTVRLDLIFLAVGCLLYLALAWGGMFTSLHS